MSNHLSNDTSISINRIRILKTGLFRCNRYIDMNDPDNVAYFEKIATPGTELVLVRDYSDECDPWKINVLAPDGRYLGRVTPSKNETVARLMDAGFEVIAVVNDSLPHNSDTAYGQTNPDGTDYGWTDESRANTGYWLSNLPYGIYLVDK